MRLTSYHESPEFPDPDLGSQVSRISDLGSRIDMAETGGFGLISAPASIMYCRALVQALGPMVHDRTGVSCWVRSCPYMVHHPGYTRPSRTALLRHPSAPGHPNMCYGL